MDQATIDALKTSIEGLGKTHNEFKSTMATRDAEIAKHGKALGETEAKLSRLNDAMTGFDEVKTRIENMEIAIKRGTFTTDTKAVDAEKNAKLSKAFRGYFSHGAESKGLEYATLAAPEVKDMSVGSGPDGGYTVFPDLNGRMVRRIFESSPIRALANVTTISTDAIEGTTDLDDAGIEWPAETTAPTDAKTPKVGKWRVAIHEMATRPKITQKLLEDSAWDVESWLTTKVADRFARGEATAFVNGDGAGKPKGFMTYPAGTQWGQIEQVNSGDATKLTSDGLMTLYYSLKEQHRARATWGMARLTVAAVRLLKDSTGQFLWQPGLQMGQPSMLLGNPVREFADMPAVAANALAVVLADFAEGYQIADRLGMTVLRDPYSTKPMVEVYCRRRVGGDVVNFEAFKIGRVAA